MKKMVIFLTALAMIAGFSSISFAGISGSSHDLSGTAGINEICVFCHVPHNPLNNVDAPLWNHADTTATFTLYDGTTGSASGVSKLCLSCHDGVTNVDAFGGSAGTVTIGAVAGNLTTDLQDDHPVMVDMPDGTDGFNARSAVDGTVAALFSNKVECASCHDPHDTTYTPFLRADNTDSAMCLNCHNK